MHATRGSQGFSLFELTLAITTLSVGLLGATAAIYASTRLDATVRQKRDAQRVVQSLSEQVRATPFDDLALTWADVCEEVKVDGGRTTATFEITEIGAGTAAPVMEVRVRVDNPRGGGRLLATTFYVNRDKTVTTNADAVATPN